MRLTHYNDIVPGVPPHYLGYEHIGTEIYFPEYRNFQLYQECYELNGKESSKCINSIFHLGVWAHRYYMDRDVSHSCKYATTL